MWISEDDRKAILGELQDVPGQLLTSLQPLALPGWSVPLRQESHGPRRERVRRSVFVREGQDQFTVDVAEARDLRSAAEVLFWWLEANQLAEVPRMGSPPAGLLGFATAPPEVPVLYFVQANLAVMVGTDSQSNVDIAATARELSEKWSWPVAPPGGLTPIGIDLEPPRIPLGGTARLTPVSGAPAPGTDLRVRAGGGELWLDHDGVMWVRPTRAALTIEAFRVSPTSGPVAAGSAKPVVVM